MFPPVLVLCVVLLQVNLGLICSLGSRDFLGLGCVIEKKITEKAWKHTVHGLTGTR